MLRSRFMHYISCCLVILSAFLGLTVIITLWPRNHLTVRLQSTEHLNVRKDIDACFRNRESV